jgi:hypothetical protein
MPRNTVKSSESRSDRLLARLRPRSIYDVMAAIACIAALGTGTAYAANTIGSADIIDESILSADIKNTEVKGVDLASDAVTTAKIANGSVLNADLGANAVAGAKVLDNALTGDDINESALGQVPSAATAGSAPVSGLTYAVSEQIANPPKSQTYGKVACPAGKSATGGGIYGMGGITQSLNSASPYGNGWNVRVNNVATTASSFYVYAMCVDVPASAG